MSATPFPLAGGTAAGFNQSTFSAVPQTQVPLIIGHSDRAFYFEGELLPVDQFTRPTNVDTAAFPSLPNTSVSTGGSTCAIGYSAILGWALIEFCANTTTSIVGSVIIARCQGEYGGEIVEPPPPPPEDRCPPIAACDILPDLSFLQEVAE